MEAYDESASVLGDEAKKSRKHIFGWLIALFLIYGVLVSVLLPPMQAPDEPYHIMNIYSSIGAEYIGLWVTLDYGTEWEELSSDENRRVDRAELRRMASAPEADLTGQNIIHYIHPEVLKYLPQALGFELGSLIGLPIYGVLLMGELFSLFFYTAICMLSLYIMPYRRELLLFLMLFPMTMQQASSLSYDATLLPLSFLFVAGALAVACTRDAGTRVRYILFLIPVLAWITYIKPPYILLLLLLLLPLSVAQRLVGLFAMGAAGVFGMYLMRKTYWGTVGLLLLTHPMHALSLWGRSMAESGAHWIKEAFGVFGWMDTGMPDIVIFLSYLVILLLSLYPGGRRYHDMRCDRFGRRGKYADVLDVVWLAIVFSLLCFAVMTSMTNHTIKMQLFGTEWTPQKYDIAREVLALDTLKDVQGRYYLPVLMIFYLGVAIAAEYGWRCLSIEFPDIWEKYHIASEQFVAICGCVMGAVMCVVLILRYWI